MSNAELTNEELIERWQGGCAESWELLWKKNEGVRKKAVIDFFKRTNFDDAMSTVGVEFWRAAKSFDVKRGTKFTTLFMQFAMFKARQIWTTERHQKRDVRRVEMSLDTHGKSCDSLREIAYSETSAIDREISRELSVEAERRLRRLPKRHRSVVRMRIDGMSLEEAGQVLGVSRERIRQIEARGLRWLRMSDEEFEIEKTRSVLLSGGA